LLGGVGNHSIGSDLGHVNESRSIADATEDALVVSLEDERNGSEDVQHNHQPLSGEKAPWFETHLENDPVSGEKQRKNFDGSLLAGPTARSSKRYASLL
jgi:hypothetical protein